VKKIRLYLAGGVFNAAQRLHNIFLETHLVSAAERMGIDCQIVSPQKESLKHLKDGVFNLEAMAEECADYCASRKFIIVCCLDGGTSDDGASVEYGIAIASTGRAITYRTDIRTAPKKELGINAMFGLDKTKRILKPCFFTKPEETELYYQSLAEEILKNASALLLNDD
jgi:nucleoside 2-deoxyribosyltransferase